MEKDKGIFSFRKHPVGELTDGKKERKQKMRRTLGMLLAAALIFNALPASRFTVSASEGETGLCEHHRSHTAECGYAEAQPCTHECSEESGCITKVLDCHHEHKVNGGEADREGGLDRDESCGYQEAQECGYVCEICDGTEPEDTENKTENDTENAGTTKETENEKKEDTVLTYNGDIQTDSFTASDTITVKATPMPTGAAPTNSAMFAASFAAPAAGTVKENISAVARVENGSTTTYVNALGDAFTKENSGATVTLLANVEQTSTINIGGGTFTLDLNGKEILKQTNDKGGPFLTVNGGELTIQDSATGGKITVTESVGIFIEAGTVHLKGGTVTGRTGVQVSRGTLTVGGDTTIIGTVFYGMDILDGKVSLFGGTFKSPKPRNMINPLYVGLKDLLPDGYGYAYFYDGEVPVKQSDFVNGKQFSSWDYTSVTVKKCNHTGEGVCTYAHNQNTFTHTRDCLACGTALGAEPCAYTFSEAAGTCAACKDSVTVAVSDTENLVYDGTEKKPGVTVTRGETALTADTDYTVAYADNKNAGENKATVTVTIGNGQGTYIKNFTIGRADVQASDLTYTAPADLLYTGQPKTAAVTVNNLTGIEKITVKYKKDNEGDFLTEAEEPGTYSVYAVISEGENYNSAGIKMGQFTISYMPAPAVLYNGGERKEWYSGDVKVSAGGGSAGYTVSDTVGGDYGDSYTIPAQQGTVTKTLYFKDGSGHISNGVEVTVNFDLTPPMGKVAVGAKWWQNVLNFVSFGNYAQKAYTVSINAEDAGGSRIDKTEYVIVTGSSQYTEAGALEAANLSWTLYNDNSKPAVPVTSSPYVAYARLTDNAGNVTYISTDGILLDSAPPVVSNLSVPEGTLEDEAAGFTFTVDEAADYYYVVLPKGSAVPDPKDIIVTCGGTLPKGGTGTVITASVASGKGAVSGDNLPASVSVTAKGLSPNTAYIVYVTAVDRTVDIADSAEGTLSGNITDIVYAGFTTKKILPAITKAPTVAGTYGQSMGEMTVTGGAAQDKRTGTPVTGTWSVSGMDSGKKPSVGTAEEVTVIFMPGNDSYDSVSAKVIPAVSQRSLEAEEVTVSDVEGTYTYTGSGIMPPVAVNTGIPASGIFISDSGAALTANDFMVSYSNNKDAGTASVTISGKGNYTGTVTKSFTIGKAPGRKVPDLTGSYTVDNTVEGRETYIYTITPVDSAVYRKGDDSEWTAGNVFDGIKPGTSVTFYAKMPETGNYEEGEAKSIAVAFPKLTPAAPALSYTRGTDADGKIALTIAEITGAQYSFDGGANWQDAREQGGFATSQTVTLAIRLKETDTHNPSPAQTVTVNLAKKDREAPPVFSLKALANGETDYTVTIPATEGCEYSFDGVTWSDVNVKTGVSVGETVTGYKRYKETNDYNASSAVSAKETMPKFTVKTPVISPAGGSYTGSVSVTIACGSTDAEIYYTTDGSMPDRGSTRYTGAFTVSAPVTVKAVAIKDGLNDSAVATASYTKKDSGGSGGNGGNSGGNENNGGQGSGSNESTNPGNGSNMPQPSVPQPTDTNTNLGNKTAPGTGTTPAGPGNGTTAGLGTAPGSGAGASAEGTGQPFLKGEDGKIGWDVIRAEEEGAEEGSIINVDMNGSTVVPGDIFDSIKGKDITIIFDMGNGILWSVDGKSVITDKAGDIDFSVKTETNAIPVDIVNNVTGERYSIQISLAYDGEFGFTAVLSIGLGRENAGYTASLYYYNESTGELEFICADTVAEDGTVSLAFTHASDYVIAIDGDGEEESGSVTEPAQPENPDKDDSGEAEASQAGQAWKPWRLIIVGALVIIMGIGAFIAVRKKGEGE